jgi:hypothetical protein
MLGQFGEALEVYRPADAALRGDALIALGKLQPLLEQETVPHPWQNLWRAYRAHALCLSGQVNDAVALARTLVPVDLYEWVHVFECLLRSAQLREADVQSMVAAVRGTDAQGWGAAVQRRMLADWRRVNEPAMELEGEYVGLIDAFDRGGLPWERALARLGYARWLRQRGRLEAVQEVMAVTLELAHRFQMPIVAADAAELAGDLVEAANWRTRTSYLGPGRP